MNLNLNLFVSTFTLIFLAELPDKTAFATLMLAARGKHVPVFIGVALAFLVQSIVEVKVGGFFGKFPEAPVHIITGVLFFIFAFMAFRKRNEVEEDESLENSVSKTGFLLTAAKSFMVIFIAEWGDLTQLATASLAAKYNDTLTIFLAATSALWSVTAIAVIIGRKMGQYVSPKQLHIGSAITFAIVGSYFILETLFR